MLLIFLSVSTGSAFAEEVYIKIRDAKLRAEPQHYAALLESLSLGQSLTKINKKGAWIQVKSKSGASGYIHESSISDRKVVLAYSNTSGSRSNNSDVVLAGKGFNKEVEKQFALQNPKASFAEVDSMERIAVGDQDLKGFVASGGLKKNA